MVKVNFLHIGRFIDGKIFNVIEEKVHAWVLSFREIEVENRGKREKQGTYKVIDIQDICVV